MDAGTLLLIAAILIVSGAGYGIYLYLRVSASLERSETIYDSSFGLREADGRLRIIRMEGRVPPAWKEAVDRTIESVDRVRRDFTYPGLYGYRTDSEMKRVVQSVKDLEREVKSIISRVESSAERSAAERNAKVLLSSIPQRLAALNGSARSPRARRLHDLTMAQYAEARQKLDAGGDIDWVVLHMMLNAADDSTRTVERVIVADQIESRADGGAEPHRQDSDSRHGSENGQDHTYRGDDGPITSSHHEGSGYATSSDSSSSSGDSGGGGDGGSD